MIRSGVPGAQGRGALPPSSLREWAPPVPSLKSVHWTDFRALGTPRDIFGQMKPAGLPPLCRPAGWVALWRRLAMGGARDAR